jgi:hypothetical protein
MLIFDCLENKDHRLEAYATGLTDKVESKESGEQNIN